MLCCLLADDRWGFFLPSVNFNLTKNRFFYKWGRKSSIAFREEGEFLKMEYQNCSGRPSKWQRTRWLLFLTNIVGKQPETGISLSAHHCGETAHVGHGERTRSCVWNPLCKGSQCRSHLAQVWGENGTAAAWTSRKRQIGHCFLLSLWLENMSLSVLKV